MTEHIEQEKTGFEIYEARIAHLRDIIRVLMIEHTEQEKTGLRVYELRTAHLRDIIRVLE